MKIGKKAKTVIAHIALTLGVIIVLGIVVYSCFVNDKSNNIELKSRYTFSVRIDSEGNVVDEAVGESAHHQNSDTFFNMTLSSIGRVWIQEFTEQFTQKYLKLSRTLKRIEINDVTTLSATENIVLISFSAVVPDGNTEYFSSWKGVLDEGRLKCDWVVQLGIDDHYDGTATIYVRNMLTPEEYGIATYNASLKSDKEKLEAENTDDEANKHTKYQIADNMLSVSYDGGETYTNVPVDVSRLMRSTGSDTALKTGSYMVSTTKTAFMYGGMKNGINNIPVTLIYSNDMGLNWITCEIDEIYTADYYYVNFFDENNGVIVVGYDKTELQESSKIYTTTNGGEKWSLVGAGPATNVIKGVRFIDENVGFFCYDYVQGMDSNLYITKDSAKTFSKIIFEEQELDSTAANQEDSTLNETTQKKLKWSDVYKEALVPKYDVDERITVYLTQGSKGTYNNGKTAAKYQSDDKGETWKYIGQVEINIGTSSEER